MKKALSLVLGAIFLVSGTALAQNVIDFEDVFAIDEFACYQELDPFFPGVIIYSINNESGAITGWPVVVRAHDNPMVEGVCGPTIPNPGTIQAFSSNYCGGNSMNNYPVSSVSTHYNSLFDNSELKIDPALGLVREAAIPRKHDGYLISFDYPIKEFSLSIVDWGDFFPNPEETHPSYIHLIAVDGHNVIVDTSSSLELHAVDLSRDAFKTNGIINLSVAGSNILNVEVRFMGKIDPGVSIDDIEFTGDLNVDIKPGDNPNCFNSNGHGVIPVAILGSEEFDVTIIDPFSVELDGQPVRVKGKSGKAGSYEDINDDGFIDLIVQIEDLGIYTPEHTTGKVTAETCDSVFFEGQDTICITQ